MLLVGLLFRRYVVTPNFSLEEFMGMFAFLILLLPLSAQADSFLLTSGTFDMELVSFSAHADLAGPQLVMRGADEGAFHSNFFGDVNASFMEAPLSHRFSYEALLIPTSAFYEVNGIQHNGAGQGFGLTVTGLGAVPNPAGHEIPVSPFAQLSGSFCVEPVGCHQFFGTGIATFTWGPTLSISPDDQHLRLTRFHVDLIATPEPSSWLLLGSGIILILAGREWKRRMTSGAGLLTRE